MATGLMLVYMHAIWLSCIHDFMGPHAWINRDTIRQLHSHDWTWSWLWYVDSTPWLVIHECLAILFGLAMAIGLLTRLAVPLAWWFSLMVCHRMTGALFGLDQVVLMLASYLIIARSGSVWSLDARITQRRGTSWLFPSADACIGNNIATRLIQIHLCVIYLFGGISKMRGEAWWNGSALWFAAVNYEYQSWDITWIGRSPWLVSGLTMATLFWETFYCALIWPRLTRPICLAMALLVHGGIAIALGMITFGTMMMVANFSFVPPNSLLARLGADRTDA